MKVVPPMQRMNPAVEKPKVIVEIYDEEQINNVLAISDLKPEIVVYIGTKKIKAQRLKLSIIACLRALGVNTKCFFYSMDMLSIETVQRELANIYNIYGDYTIDLTGGGEVAVAAAGILAKEFGIPMIRFDKYAGKYRNVMNCPYVEKIKSDPHFNARAFMKLAGGEIKDHGHLSIDELTYDELYDVMNLWKIYKRHIEDWSKFVSYLQYVSRLDCGSPSYFVDADEEVECGGMYYRSDAAILNELNSARLIEDYFPKKGHVKFKYKSSLLRSCLTDVGVTLELFVFAATSNSGLFDDVKLSVVIDWDGEDDDPLNTVNEIDVMLVKGQVPIFISCKSGQPTVMALNEIRTLSDHFGGMNARPVLVTMADARVTDPHLCQRANDMDVTIIDFSDLDEDKLLSRLLTAAKL